MSGTGIPTAPLPLSVFSCTLMRRPLRVWVLASPRPALGGSYGCSADAG